MFVLDDPERLGEVLQAWEAVGIRGATIVESTGIQRLRRQIIPMRYMFPTTGPVEEGHLTLFVIVSSLALAEACLTATESVIGDLDAPNTGVFAAWPLALVRGVSAAARGA
jgi:hypothetical protein